MEREDPLVRAELLVAAEEVARRRLRGRREDARSAQPPVELGRIDVDAVAQALVAETDVERHDLPVWKAIGGVRQIGRRVEDDRRVLGGESQPATAAACRIAATISSSSWSFVRQATAPASTSASRS